MIAFTGWSALALALCVLGIAWTIFATLITISGIPGVGRWQKLALTIVFITGAGLSFITAGFATTEAHAAWSAL